LTTPIYGIPELAATSSERTQINYNLRILEALAGQVKAVNINALSPPSTIAEGEMVLIGSPATGAFIGFSGGLAIYLSGAYKLIAPNALIGAIATRSGWYLPNGLGTGWSAYGGGGGGATTDASLLTSGTLNDARLSANVPLLSAVGIFTKAQGSASVALVDAASIVVDASLSNTFLVTLGGNRTLSNPSSLQDGFVYNFHVKQDATGSRLLTYGSVFKFGAAGAPLLSTAANASDWMSFQCVGTDLRFAGSSKGF
jgi:Protein of unknown function (DUF2793)